MVVPVFHVQEKNIPSRLTKETNKKKDIESSRENTAPFIAAPAPGKAFAD